MPLDSIQIARICHGANRVYCQTLGDDSHPPWEEAPDWQTKSIILGVEAIMKNPDLTPTELHLGWVIEKTKDGWKYGPEKDLHKKEHPCMVPFDDLSTDHQAKDHIFGGIVRVMLDVP